MCASSQTKYDVLTFYSPLFIGSHLPPPHIHTHTQTHTRPSRFYIRAHFPRTAKSSLSRLLLNFLITICKNLRHILPKLFKADLQSANFSRANGTFRWRMLSFQSPFEANKIQIICKATCFKQKTNHKAPKIKTFFDFRSSHQRCSVEKDVPKNYASFAGKHLCLSLNPTTLLKRDSNTEFFW